MINVSSSLQLKSVVFDLDGVLLDSEAQIKHAFSFAYQTVVGKDIPPIDKYWQYLGEPFPEIMRKMNLPQTMCKVFRDASSANIKLAKLYPGTYEILNYLSANDIKIALLTGKDLKRTEEILKYFNLREYFHIIVTPDTYCKPKPYPDGLIYILNQLGTLRDEAVFIGDSVNDMLCAKRAKVTGIAALWGEEKRLDRLLSLANYSALSLSDLLLLIEKI
jgi:AHBA synthesis associated protein